MPRRVPALALTTIAGFCLAASAAGAATIHACVKPKSGATRIVSAKAKCRRGEKKLSWGTTGPAGKTGPAGTQGPAGAPGAAGIGPAFLVGATNDTIGATPALLFVKTLPPGDYVVSAPLLLGAKATTEGKDVSVQCFAVDKAGTTLTNSDLSGESSQLFAIGAWETPLVKESASDFTAESTLTLVGASESKVTNTMGVACEDSDTPSGVVVTSVLAELVATQVSSITT